MTREQRAKQFMPFDAMKGLQEALADREERHSRVERRDVSDEAAEQISAVLSKLVKGDRVRLEYYRAFHDVTREGRITALSPVFKYLVLDGEKIFFDDIYKVKITDR